MSGLETLAVTASVLQSGLGGTESASFKDDDNSLVGVKAVSVEQYASTSVNDESLSLVGEATAALVSLKGDTSVPVDGKTPTFPAEDKSASLDGVKPMSCASKSLNDESLSLVGEATAALVSLKGDTSVALEEDKPAFLDGIKPLGDNSSPFMECGKAVSVDETACKSMEDIATRPGPDQSVSLKGVEAPSLNNALPTTFQSDSTCTSHNDTSVPTAESARGR